MSNLIFLLGPTNVGKTTLIDNCIKQFGAYGIFVGKVLRAKYGEDYFKGQAAPEHTKEESLRIMDEGIQKGIRDGKELIMVDGQPRSDDQLKYVVDNYLKKENTNIMVYFLLLYCPEEVRKKRMESRDQSPEKRKLAEQRFYGDLPQVYKLVHDLVVLGYKNLIYPLNSEDSLREFENWLLYLKSEDDFLNSLVSTVSHHPPSNNLKD